jgi:secondary thiamine-phosphate synthase enzyme
LTAIIACLRIRFNTLDVRPFLPDTLTMIHQDTIRLLTSGHRDMHDITAQVARIVTAAGICSGTTHVFNVGSTACVGPIEYEPGLEADLPAMLNKLIPPSRQYGHEQAWHDGNGHSHLQATMMGPSLTLSGKVARGQRG